MRILHVVTLVSPDGAFGGPVRVALNQARALQARGHDVSVAAASRGFDSAPRVIDGVDVRLFPVRPLSRSGGYAALTSPGLQSWIRSNARKYDVAHVHYARDLVILPAVRALHRLGVPIVLQPHGMVVPSEHRLAGLVDALWVRPQLAQAASVVALSEDEDTAIAAVARRDLSTVILPNGVPVSAEECTSKSSAVPEFLFVGRLHPVKRADMFVRAAVAVVAQGLRLTAAVVGPDEGAASAVDRELSLGSGVATREGALAPELVPRRIAQCSVLVLPSERESFGMVAAEAMAQGKPVIVAANHGIAPLVAKGAGLLFDGSEDDLVRVIARLARDPDLRNAMGTRAREIAMTDLSLDGVARRLENVYETCHG